MSLLDGKGPKTILGSIAREAFGEGRETNYIKHLAKEFGYEYKPKKRRK